MIASQALVVPVVIVVKKSAKEPVNEWKTFWLW
jgi:hypothetical protein